MNIFEIILTAAALAADAFAVSVCKGLAAQRVRGSDMFSAGAWFGTFQGIMLLLGCVFGVFFKEIAESFDHWIAFSLLFIIGANMIKESLEGKNDKKTAGGVRKMLSLSFATSIDAFAVGISFTMSGDVNVVLSSFAVGAVTFLFSALGVKLGALFGRKYKSGAELFGGAVLILIGLKILIEHLYC